MKKKIFIVTFIFVLLLFICGIIIYFNDNLRFKFTYEYYNYAAYSNGKSIKVDIPIDNGIIYLNEEEVIDFLENGTGIIYFGYPSCPWCRNIIEVLIDASKDSNIKSIYYVDTHSLNSEYDKIIDILGDYLDYDSDGNKRLYVPDVYFFKNGEIMTHHLSVVDSYKDPFKGMNDEEIKELKNIYLDGIKLIEGD